MRLEAAGNILQMAFLAVTAASTLTSALALLGWERYAGWMLVIGVVAVFAFAFGYVESGVYNRKNREKQDRGNNFAKPQNVIDDSIIARAIQAAREGRELTEREREAVKTEVFDAYQEYRDGIEIYD